MHTYKKERMEDVMVSELKVSLVRDSEQQRSSMITSPRRNSVSRPQAFCSTTKGHCVYAFSGLSQLPIVLELSDSNP